MKKQKSWKILTIIAGVGLAVFVLIQFIPLGKNLNNPPVTGEPKWNSPQTRAQVQRACFDCHSNQTVYPWYSYVAPASWLLEYDIKTARANMNFSEWSADIDGQIMADAIAQVIKNGSMPPPQYLLMHPEARYNDTEKEQLISGLRASLTKK